MNFNEWLAANSFNAETLSEAQKLKLQAAWRAEQNPPPKVEPKGEAKADATADTFDAKVKALDAENERIAYIRDSSYAVMQSHKGDVQKCDQIKELCQSAVADEKVDKRAFDLALLRLSRNAGPHVFSASNPQASGDVVEAAICLSHRLPNVEKAFDERTLDAAHKNFRRGISLKKLMMLGATANGYRGDDSDYNGVCRAAIGGRGNDAYGYGPMSSVGVSTGVQVPGILSNIANKFLASSFMNVEQAWRGIAKIRSVNDFKQVTTYRMGGNNTFLRVAPGGEIKHGALSETSYTNQAKTYGRLLGISREDYINDDLGAFVSVTQELGRGAADGLNNIFWATWLNDSTFFPTDKSKLNYDDGATDSVLSVAGLDNAESIFAVQTKPDGTPLGATPKILLVPPALKNTALTLMTPTGQATGAVALGNPNIFAGRYTVVSSAFLPRTSLNDENGVSQTVTGSSTAWYLLCDPMDIPCIEVAFLFGKDTPTVETDQFEFDRLGMATRAFFDFGVSLQEYRGGLKLKGAA